MTFWLNDDSDGTFWQYSLTLGIQKTFRPPPTGVSPDWVVDHPFLTRSGELVLGGARPTQKIPYSNKNHRCGISHYHASIKIHSHMHFVWGSRILRRGSVLYGIDPMQIWAPHKNSRIRIRTYSHYFWSNLQIRTTGFTCILFSKIFDESGSEDPVPVSHLIQQLWKIHCNGFIKHLKVRTTFLWIWTFPDFLDFTQLKR
jgi:hypothetical protein